MKKVLLSAAICISLGASAQIMPPRHLISDSIRIRAMARVMAKEGVVKLGETMPDISEKTINFGRPALKLSDFRGKLVILDWWNRGCSNCIQMMPYMDSLQKEFGDRIQIIGACSETSAVAQWIFDALKKRGDPVGLPSIVEDSVLLTATPMAGVPFEVWIDPEGRLLGATGAEYVTRANIAAVLAGKKINFPNCTWDPDFDADKPLQVRGNGMADSAFFYRSVFSGPAYGSEYFHRINIVEKADSTSTRIAIINASMAYMYKWAYSKLYPGRIGRIDDFFDKQIISDFPAGWSWLDYHWPGSYPQPQSNEVNSPGGLYCYNLTLPPGFSLSEAYRWLIQDMDRFFQVRSSFEERTTACVDLVTLPGFVNKPSDYIHSKGGDRNGGDTLSGEFTARYVFLINYDALKVPYVIDRTGIKGQLYAPLIVARNATLEDLQKQLRRYKLDLVPAQRKLDVLVLMKSNRGGADRQLTGR